MELGAEIQIDDVLLNIFQINCDDFISTVETTDRTDFDYPGYEANLDRLICQCLHLVTKVSPNQQIA